MNSSFRRKVLENHAIFRYLRFWARYCSIKPMNAVGSNYFQGVAVVVTYPEFHFNWTTGSLACPALHSRELHHTELARLCQAINWKAEKLTCWRRGRAVIVSLSTRRCSNQSGITTDSHSRPPSLGRKLNCTRSKQSSLSCLTFHNCTSIFLHCP